jgi:hypothetical protein
MPGMIASVWGPMAWRLMHSLAHAYDMLPEGGSPEVADLMLAFMLALPGVLPCRECRDDSTRITGTMATELRRAVFARRAMGATFTLHNTVNRKLGKPQFDRIDVAQRRACVWSGDDEVLGLLFIIALNFDNNSDPDKAARHAMFFRVFIPLLEHVGRRELAAALRHGMAGMPLTKSGMVVAFYEAHKRVTCRDAGLENLIARYSLCSTHI